MPTSKQIKPTWAAQYKYIFLTFKFKGAYNSAKQTYYIIPALSISNFSKLYSEASVPATHPHSSLSSDNLASYFREKTDAVRQETPTTNHTETFLQGKPTLPPSLLQQDRSWHNYSSIWTLDPIFRIFYYQLPFSIQSSQPLPSWSTWLLSALEFSPATYYSIFLVPLTIKPPERAGLTHWCHFFTSHVLHDYSDLDLMLSFHLSSLCYCLHEVNVDANHEHFQPLFNQCFHSIWHCWPSLFSVGFRKITPSWFYSSSWTIAAPFPLHVYPALSAHK